MATPVLYMPVAILISSLFCKLPIWIAGNARVVNGIRASGSLCTCCLALHIFYSNYYLNPIFKWPWLFSALWGRRDEVAEQGWGGRAEDIRGWVGGWMDGEHHEQVAAGPQSCTVKGKLFPCGEVLVLDPVIPVFLYCDFSILHWWLRATEVS